MSNDKRYNETPRNEPAEKKNEQVQQQSERTSGGYSQGRPENKFPQQKPEQRQQPGMPDQSRERFPKEDKGMPDQGNTGGQRSSSR